MRCISRDYLQTFEKFKNKELAKFSFPSTLSTEERHMAHQLAKYAKKKLRRILLFLHIFYYFYHRLINIRNEKNFRFTTLEIMFKSKNFPLLN